VVDAAGICQGSTWVLTLGGCFGLADDVGGHLGEVAAPCGSAVLVADYAQVFAFAGEFQDGQEEVFAACSVDPTGPEDQVSGAGLGQGLLSGELACAVDADWIGGIGLDVGFGAGAVEDVVGGEVDYTRADGGGFFADNADSVAVDGVGEVGLGFGFIDRGVGCGVHDPSGAEGADGVADGLEVYEVEGGAQGSDDFAQR